MKNYFPNSFCLYWTDSANIQIACMAECPQECHLFKVQNIHITPFVKPCAILNLAVQNVFYIQTALHKSCFTNMFLQNDIIISIKCPKIDQKIFTLNPQLHTIRGQP